MKLTNIKLGVFGFGCVGTGLYHVLNQTRGIQADIKKICIKHPEKKRSIDSHFFTTDKKELLNDPEINVIVELIDNADEAFEIVTTALKNGKGVVTANKKMIAEHAQELYELQQKYNLPLLYEAACCASIPIIRNLEEYYDNDLLTSVEGILNGSTNYILTKIFEQNMSFDLALKQAQELGYAESDPTLDVYGIDAKYKLCIILLHAFGIFVKPENVYNYGIQNLNDFDIAYARQKNLEIKLIAKCIKRGEEIIAYVTPKFVRKTGIFATVGNEYNAVRVESIFSENQMFSGKGAGDKATGSAVLSDISALTYGYKYEYKKLKQTVNQQQSQNFDMEIYVRYPANSKIDFSKFSSISERYESVEFNYAVGKINLKNIKSVAWLENTKQDYSIIRF